ncbi:radical SAM protein [Campylobacter devanensis]|uniref:radical SAM protein n=1 Tax=Campylobacter devanensis TaxID=3161138 RepID=UPI0015D6C27E|nr:radical SAM protein [Campylobacter sp. P0108]
MGGVYLYNWYNDIGVNIEYENIHSIDKRKITFTDKFKQEYIDFLKTNYFINETDFSKEFYLQEYNKQLQKEQDELHLILLPAGYACNFDCVYCYENHNDRSRFKGKHSDIIYDLIKQKNPKKLHIEYFGGEPLLGLAWILDFEERIKDIEHTSSMTTNGYLLNIENFKALLDKNVRTFQITLDGIAKTHDKLRIKYGGGKTYDTILNNLKDIQTLKDNFKIIIRCNFNESNATPDYRKDYFTNIAFTKKDYRFNLIFRPIGLYSKFNNTTTQRHIDACYSSTDNIKHIWEEEAQNQDYLLGDVGFYTLTGGAICYAAKESCYTITPNLEVLKCTVAVDQDINKFGDIKDGLKLDPQKLKNWEQYSKFDESCLKCFYFFQCMNRSCPLHNLENKRKICPIKHSDEKYIVKMIKRQKNILERLI